MRAPNPTTESSRAAPWLGHPGLPAGGARAWHEAEVAAASALGQPWSPEPAPRWRTGALTEAAGRAVNSAQDRLFQLLRREHWHGMLDPAERPQAAEPPLRDLALALVALVDSGIAAWDPRLTAVRRAIEGQLLAGPFRPDGPRLGRELAWRRDVDQSAAVVAALVKQDPSSGHGSAVRRAVAGILSVQRLDGGWAAPRTVWPWPFLGGGSSPETTGRALEALALLEERPESACRRATAYLRRTQERDGSWSSRRGLDRLPGTVTALCGLARSGMPGWDRTVSRALGWIESTQNDDGSWREGRGAGYRMFAGPRPPAATLRTAWALMGLLAYRTADDEPVRRGIAWLVQRPMGKEGSACYALLALGRFCRAARGGGDGRLY